MADEADDFDLKSHQEMWHTFNKMALYGVVGIASLLIVLAIVVL
jgi:hypothetical protein